MPFTLPDVGKEVASCAEHAQADHRRTAREGLQELPSLFAPGLRFGRVGNVGTFEHR
jgi:hypothetical protein